MTLKADVLARIPVQQLTNLTRLVDSDPPGVNDATLSQAVSDAEGMFLHKVRVVYDSANDKHVNFGVRLVRILLQTYSQADIDKNEKRLDVILKQLKDLAETEGGDRLTSISDSEYQRSDAETGRPPFDRSDFEGIH